jgi:16S rRNA G527 N7-methylase RsmG
VDLKNPKIQTFHKLLTQVQEKFSLKSVLKEAHFQRHVLDMNFLLTQIQETTIAEVGAGVGINIFLLSILQPELKLIGIERNQPRLGWMKVHAKKLGLKNLEFLSNTDELSKVGNKKTAILLKAFSPVSTLSKVLDDVRPYICKLYVMEGVGSGLSKNISEKYFPLLQTVLMTHGKDRCLKTYKVR